MTVNDGDVRSRVIAIIAEQAQIDVADVRATASLQELGLDSLGLVEVIFGIEEAFDVAVPFNANEPSAGPFDTSTVNAVVTAVEALVVGRPA